MTARERLQERMENLEEFASRANSAAGFLEACRELWGKLDDGDKGVLTDRVCKNLVDDLDECFDHIREADELAENLYSFFSELEERVRKGR